MGKRWVLLVVFAVFFIFLSEQAEAGTFQCEMSQGTTCLSNQTMLVRLNNSVDDSPNNSHAQVANASSNLYNWTVCCWTDAFRTMDNTCSASATAVLQLEDLNNSHVQANTQSGYIWDACLNVTSGNITCEYPNDACSAGFDEVVSMASSEVADDNLTNAHVGEFPVYKRKVCCQVGGQTPPVVDSVDLSPINSTTSDELLCDNPTATDVDGDSVTLHYNWFLDGVSQTVLNMPMDYDSDLGITHDISGLENNGSVHNGTTFLPTAGYVGGAFLFDGVDDFISVPDDTSLKGMPQVSVSVWVKPNRTGVDMTIVEKVAGSYRLHAKSDNTYSVAVKNESTDTVSEAGGVVSTSWGHLVMTYNGSVMSAYFNGNGIGSGAITGDIFSSDDILVIGCDGDPGDFCAGDFFNGTIDELIVWNRSLTADEVTTLYNTNNKYMNNSELTRDDYWNCSITPVDSTGLNGTTVFSNETYVNGSLPTTPNLTYPLDGNTSVFERIVNHAWTSTERDGDTVTYSMNLSVESGDCSTESETTGISDKNFSAGPLCFDQRYWWNVTACDDQEGCSSISEMYNYTIASVLSVTIPNTTMPFGTLANLQSATTDDDTPLPFYLENNGNVFANVTVNGTVFPFSSVSLGDTAWQFKVDDYESGSINTSGSQITYTPLVDGFIPAAKQLNYSDATDRAELHINITVPVDEPPGSKVANVTIQSVLAE